MAADTADRKVRAFIHDEIEEVAVKGGRIARVRVRIWAGEDATPIVLVSPVEFEPHPSRFVGRLANYIAGTLLRHSEFGLLYFEQEAPGAKIVDQIFFDFTGHHQRLRYHFGNRKPVSWAWLEYHAGGQVAA